MHGVCVCMCGMCVAYCMYVGACIQVYACGSFVVYGTLYVCLCMPLDVCAVYV